MRNTPEWAQPVSLYSEQLLFLQLFTKLGYYAGARARINTAKIDVVPVRVEHIVQQGKHFDQIAAKLSKYNPW